MENHELDVSCCAIQVWMCLYSISLWVLTPVGVDNTCIMFDFTDNSGNREITLSALNQFISRIVQSSAVLDSGVNRERLCTCW